MTDKGLIEKYGGIVKAIAINIYVKFRSLGLFTVDDLYNIGLFATALLL